jgi:hypothetical protein
MNHTEKIDGDLMLSQYAIGLHHLPVRSALVFGHTISVMKRARTVEAEADAKVLSSEKTAPLVCQENAIGLDAVSDVFTNRTVFALEFHNPAKIVQPENSRFPAVPREKNLAPRDNGNLLNNVLLQQIVGHPKRPASGV